MNTAIKSHKRTLSFALVALLALIGAGCSLLGGGSLEKAAAVNVAGDGLALKGYDAVAYFNENAPRAGTPEFTADWNGAKWRFASAANRDAFSKDPTKYAPQYGGYCAWAVSQGYTADVDPNIGKVVDGKLYLNYNPSVAQKWNENVPKYIMDGDNNWKNLAGKAEESRKDK